MGPIWIVKSITNSFLLFCNMVKLPNIYNRKIIHFCTKWKQKSIGTYLELGSSEIQFRVGVKQRTTSFKILIQCLKSKQFVFKVANFVQNVLFFPFIFSDYLKKVKVTFMKLKMHICPNIGPSKFYQFDMFRFGLLYSFSLRTFLTKSDPSPLSSCMCEY